MGLRLIAIILHEPPARHKGAGKKRMFYGAPSRCAAIWGCFAAPGWPWETDFGKERFRNMKILVINAGSSSLKYQLIDMDNEQMVCKGNCERIGMPGGIFTHKTADGRELHRRP